MIIDNQLLLIVIVDLDIFYNFNNPLHIDIISLIYRGKRHRTVVELLKGSGTYPSLLVQWRPMSVLKHQSSSSSLGSKSGLSVTFDKLNDDGIHRSASVASRTSTRTEQLIMSRFPGSDPQGVRALAREFKLQVNVGVLEQEIKTQIQCIMRPPQTLSTKIATEFHLSF